MASAALGAAYRHLRDLFGSGTVIGLADGALLARYASSRDGAAFEALVSRHGPMVLATCRAILKNEHDVEDAFQATFLILARKAGSVRAGDALGGWLHRVACRAAVQASIEAKRRRRRESEASAMGPPDASRPASNPDIGPVLHEEVDRLPDSLRLPVVLCDLEGLTYEQAAGRLSWTVPTLRGRLAKGRRRLRDRLTRRGVTAPAAPLLTAPGVVPPALARSAVAAATEGLASAGAPVLTRITLRGMLMTKLKIAAAAALGLAALGLAIARVIAAGPGHPEDPGPAMKPKASAPAVIEDAPSPAPGEPIEIRGMVVGPDGRPVSGASVRLAQSLEEDASNPEVLTRADGRFAIRVRRSIRERLAAYLARFPRLVALAPGYAPGWVEGIFRADAPAVLSIRLAEAGPAIEGRVVDLEGRPVAGARVVQKDLWYAREGGLARWTESARVGGTRGIWQELQNVPIDPPLTATTDAVGRFRMAGPGRDRVAGLLLSGPSIATETVYVLGHDEPEIRTVDKSWVEPRPFVVHNPRFQHASAPTRPIEGLILDKDTGRPIAGVMVRGNVDRESDHTLLDGIEATTDDRGRFRLTGLPKAAGYRIFTFARGGAPYPNVSQIVSANGPGMEPVAFDLTLKRGVLVRGRVTDKATGRPVKSEVDAYAFSDNPHVKDFPGYADGYRSEARSKGDGRFEVVAVPGRGIIAVRADDSRYLGGVGARSIEGRRVPGVGEPDTFETLPSFCPAGGYHVLAGVDLDPRAESVDLELQVDPGRSLKVSVVNPDGHTLAGAKAQGVGDIYPVPQLQESSTFEVHALDPSRPRRLTVVHAGRKLVGSVYLKGDEPDAMTLRLRPWGVVTGRVVTEEGRPRPGLQVFTLGGIILKHPEEEGVLPAHDGNGGLKTDADGRFRAEGLVPGLKYGGAAADGVKGLGKLFGGLVVVPGEVKDLGDLKPTLDDREADR